MDNRGAARLGGQSPAQPKRSASTRAIPRPMGSNGRISSSQGSLPPVGKTDRSRSAHLCSTSHTASTSAIGSVNVRSKPTNNFYDAEPMPVTNGRHQQQHLLCAKYDVPRVGHRSGLSPSRQTQRSHGPLASVFAPADSLATPSESSFFSSCPNIPGSVSSPNSSPTPSLKSPLRRASAKAAPPGMRLTPLDVAGARADNPSIGVVPSIGLPDVVQAADDLRRSTTRGLLPPIQPAGSGERRPESKGLSRSSSLTFAPAQGTAITAMAATALESTSSQCSDVERPPAERATAATEANDGRLSSIGKQRTVSDTAAPQDTRAPFNRSQSEGAALGGPGPATTTTGRPERKTSTLSDDAFAEPSSPKSPQEERESLLRPWIPASGVVRLLRPVRAADMREAAFIMGLSQRARQARLNGIGGGDDEVDSSVAPVSIDGAPGELSDLDVYLPNRKLGVFVGSWNMKGDKVPPTVLDFLLPPAMEEIQDVVVLGSQESPANRRAWEIRIQETLGPSHILLRSVTLGVLYLIVFIRRELLWFVTDVEEDALGTRPGSMIKTKGAVALSMRIFGTSLLFITSHLTAHQANVQDRHNDVARIAAGLRLTDGKEGSQAEHAALAERFDYVFWGGDMNYRCNTSYAKAIKLIQGGAHMELLECDQLIDSMNTGQVFDGYHELPILFPPTFKFDVGSDVYDTSTKQRTPSWTDRIVYAARDRASIEGLVYDSCRDVYFSDHKPVYGLFKVAVQPPVGDALKMSTCPSMGNFNRAVYIEGNTRRLARLTVAGSTRSSDNSAACVIL